MNRQASAKPLSWNEIRNGAIQFVREWDGVTSESAEAQSFWNEFLNVFGVPRRRVATFEHQVEKAGGKAGYIDLFWPGVMIAEHKSRGKDLKAAFNQAVDYFPGISDDELPRFVVVSDFAMFHVHDLETGEESEFPLAELHDNIHVFGFIAGYETRTFKEQDPSVGGVVVRRGGSVVVARLESRRRFCYAFGSCVAALLRTSLSLLKPPRCAPPLCARDRYDFSAGMAGRPAEA